MSGLDPNAGGALVVPGGGASLPTASAAGELPVSAGAGSAYTATSAGDVLALGMVAALTGEPAGAALISDGAGDIATTSADVSAMLAAADAAAARTALGVAASASTPLFEAGNGWTLIASQVSGTAATTYANGEDGLPGLARFTMTTSGNPTAAALNGPRIERALTWDFAKRWRIRVSFVGVSTTLPGFGANISVWLYLRDGAGGVYAKQIVIYHWNDAPGGPLAYPPWTGGTKEFRLNRDTTILTGILSAAGVWSQSSSEVLPFTPTHVGIAGEQHGAAGAGAGYIDVRDLVIESFV